MSVVSIEGSFEQAARKALGHPKVNVLIIASNSAIKSNGKATLPPEVTNLVPVVWYRKNQQEQETKTDIRSRLAYLMKKTGHHKTHLLGRLNGTHIVTMPTKFHWKDSEDLGLIKQEASRLVEGVDKRGWKYAVIMRPVEDSSKWEGFEKQFLAILEKAKCKFAVYSGTPQEPQPPKVVKSKDKDYEGKFSDLPKEEQSRLRSLWQRRARAKKAKEAKAAEKKAEEDALQRRHDLEVKRQEAEIADVLKYFG